MAKGASARAAARRQKDKWKLVGCMCLFGSLTLCLLPREGSWRGNVGRGCWEIGRIVHLAYFLNIGQYGIKV